MWVTNGGSTKKRNLNLSFLPLAITHIPIRLATLKELNTFENKKDSLAPKGDLAAIELKLSQQISRLETTVAKTETKLILWAFVF